MKKTYINPTLTVVKIKSAHLLAGSFIGDLGNNGVDGAAALGRESTFSDWDEDVFMFDQKTMSIDQESMSIDF